MNENPIVTRIDIDKRTDGCLILTYLEGWKPGNKPLAVSRSDQDFGEFIEELKADGWDVITWGIGARAWRGERRPVRTASGIRIKRRQIYNAGSWYRDNGINTAVNLAFYL